jgi:hypothetical protein
MAAPTLISELSQTAGSNGPAGSVSPTELDDYDRAHASFIAQLRDGKGLSVPVSLASATSTDIGGQNSPFVEITGTTTITGFGTNYNGPRFLRFAGVLTLTNGSSLALPGGADITTAVGDTCVAVPNIAASGWNVISFQRAASIPFTSPLPVANGGTGLTAAGPTFSAYQSTSAASVSDSTYTKTTYDTELWDTNSNFASSRFTPTVAGYYQINASYQVAPSAPGFLTIYKNGSEHKRGAWSRLALATSDFSVSGLVYCNGSTDYIEIYIYQVSGGAVTLQGAAGGAVSWFDGHFVRGT